MPLIHRALIGLLFFALPGCSFKSECEKAVDHIVRVISKDSTVPDDKRKEMQSFRNRKIILEQCYEDFRPEKGIECVLKASSLKQINACRDSMKIE